MIDAHLHVAPPRVPGAGSLHPRLEESAENVARWLREEMAVDHPNVRFVIAHVGNPWMADAAAVVYKNVNVWADLSGLVVGPDWLQPDEEKLAMLEDLRGDVLKAVRYSERPNRFLYGS